MFPSSESMASTFGGSKQHSPSVESSFGGSKNPHAPQTTGRLLEMVAHGEFQDPLSSILEADY